MAQIMFYKSFPASDIELRRKKGIVEIFKNPSSVEYTQVRVGAEYTNYIKEEKFIRGLTVGNDIYIWRGDVPHREIEDRNLIEGTYGVHVIASTEGIKIRLIDKSVTDEFVIEVGKRVQGFAVNLQHIPVFLAARKMF